MRIQTNRHAPRGHCAGWVKPLMGKFGCRRGYDMVSRTEPVRVMRVYKDKAKLAAHPYD